MALLPLLALAPLALLALAPLVTAGVTAGRKKRDIHASEHLVALLAHDVDPEEMQQKMMAAYIGCAMDDTTMGCLQQLACKYEDFNSDNAMDSEERQMSQM